LNTASERDFLEPCILQLWPWKCLDTEQCTKFYILLMYVFSMYISQYA